MAIEFPCPHCTQLLRVGDDSAGKTAKCPKCNGLAKIPGGDAPASFGPPEGSLGAPLPSSLGPPSPSPFGEAPAKNPFSDAGAASNPYSSQPKFGAPDSYINPYTSPQIAYQAPLFQDVPITPQVVGVEPILSYAWQLWQQHLGLLLGVTVTIVAISYVVGFMIAIPQIALSQNGEIELARTVYWVGQIFNNLVQLYLGIGMYQIALKMARRLPVQYTDLFGAGPVFFPVLGAYILYFIASFFAILLLVVPFFILILMCWPYYFLLIDKKTGIIESFSVATTITKNNWGTAILLALLSVGIFILGVLALCIGTLFAAPLINLLWAVAYLMMSGQIPLQPSFGPPGQYGQQYDQPAQPPKW